MKNLLYFMLGVLLSVLAVSAFAAGRDLYEPAPMISIVSQPIVVAAPAEPTKPAGK